MEAYMIENEREELMNTLLGGLTMAVLFLLAAYAPGW